VHGEVNSNVAEEADEEEEDDEEDDDDEEEEDDEEDDEDDDDEEEEEAEEEELSIPLPTGIELESVVEVECFVSVCFSSVELDWVGLDAFSS
jgi:hypothetical protein